ncbi:Odorant receptor 45b, partial [Pseudolycoriella hygida]
SYDIHEAAYFTDWYKYDVSNQRLISLIILRSQTPCGIVVPFFESSLQTFTTILRATGSYIALFRTFLE